MAQRNGWDGVVGGFEFGERVYGERRTFELDQIFRQGESSIAEDDEIRTFALDKIYRQHQE
jgi:hypothetical protein